MDEGEHHEADAFDFDYDVFVLFDPLHVTFVAFEGAAGDADMLVFLEIAFAEYVATGRVGSREEPEEMDGGRWNYLYPVIGGIAVNPERDCKLRVSASFSFKGEGILSGGADEEDVRDYGFLLAAFSGVINLLLREEDFLTEGGEHFRRREVAAGSDGKPFSRVFIVRNATVHFCV